MPSATRLIATVLVCAGVVGIVAYLWQQGHRAPPPAPEGSDAQPVAGSNRPNARALVAGLGRLEPEGGVIDIGGMAGDRLNKLTVTEGQQVREQEILAYLESHSLRLAEKKLAEIQLNEAKVRQTAEVAYGEALVAEAEGAVRQLELHKLELDAQTARFELAEANLALAQRDLERLEAVGDPVVSQQELEHQQLLVRQAQADVKSASASLAKLKGSLELNEAEARAKLRTAQASQERLKAAVQTEGLQQTLALAEARLEQTLIRAPQDAQVLKIMTRPGEIIGAKPILRLGDTGHMAVVAEIYETDVHRVHPGQQATIKSSALDEPLKGVVKRVGLTVAKNEVISLNPTASADSRVVEVVIGIDENKMAASLINLQVEVEIQVGSGEAARVAREGR